MCPLEKPVRTKRICLNYWQAMRVNRFHPSHSISWCMLGLLPSMPPTRDLPFNPLCPSTMHAYYFEISLQRFPTVTSSVRTSVTVFVHPWTSKTNFIEKIILMSSVTGFVHLSLDQCMAWQMHSQCISLGRRFSITMPGVKLIV